MSSGSDAALCSRFWRRMPQLPKEVIKGLYEVRKRDIRSKALSIELNKEEKELWRWSRDLREIMTLASMRHLWWRVRRDLEETEAVGGDVRGATKGDPSDLRRD